MELCRSGEPASSAADQEIPHILWNLKVHYRAHNSLAFAPVLGQISPVRAPIPLLLSFLILAHLRIRLTSGLFPSGFPTKILYTPLLSSIHATCPTHLIFLDLTPEQ